MTLTVVEDATPPVVILNVAVVALAGTVTVDGTVPAALSAVSEIVVPPDGAARLRVTVPVDILPPTMVVGDKDTLCNSGLCTVSAAL